MVSKGNALGYSCINNGWRKMTGLDFDQSSHRISQSIEMNGKYIRPLHSSYPKCFLQSSLSQYYIKLSMWFSPDPKMHHHHRSQGRVPLICSTFVYDVPVYLHCCSNWLLGGCDMMTALSLSLFNQTGRCFATTGISLFIIRHSIIMRRWSWFVDKQLKSDAERPSPININELHRIHRNVLNINLCSNQPKFTLSLLSNSICLHWILFSGFCLGKPNLCSYWKCTNTLWHCLFDTALRINDSNVCYHYRSSSSIALRGWCIKNHIWINTQHTRSMAMINGNPVWRMSIFMFDSHCLLLLIWSNKCKHYAKRVP